MGVSLYIVFYKKLARPTRNLGRLLLLMLSFLLYLSIGSYINQIINYDLDVDQQTSIIEYLNEFVDTHSACFNHSDYKILYELIDHAIETGIKFGNNRLDNDTFTPNWVFGGETLFFTFTLLTTIGYGHIAPITKAGKLFCIAYIIVGVPLTLLLLKAIVTRMEHAILHDSCCTCMSDESAREDEADEEKKRLIDTSQHQVLNYSTMSESSRAENVPTLVEVVAAAQPAPTPAAPKPEPPSVGRHYKAFLAVGLFLLTFIYIIPSFVLTSYTESQWSFLDAIYYCYISIATIGFGDLVPGYEQSGAERNYYRLLMTIFLFVGILTNMLFLNLFIRLPLLNRFSCDHHRHHEDLDSTSRSASSRVVEASPEPLSSVTSDSESAEQTGLLTRAPA